MLTKARPGMIPSRYLVNLLFVSTMKRGVQIMNVPAAVSALLRI